MKKGSIYSTVRSCKSHYITWIKNSGIWDKAIHTGQWTSTEQEILQRLLEDRVENIEELNVRSSSITSSFKACTHCEWHKLEMVMSSHHGIWFSRQRPRLRSTYISFSFSSFIPSQDENVVGKDIQGTYDWTVWITNWNPERYWTYRNMRVLIWQRGEMLLTQKSYT